MFYLSTNIFNIIYCILVLEYHGKVKKNKKVKIEYPNPPENTPSHVSTIYMSDARPLTY